MSDENIQPCLSLRVVRTEVDHFYFPIFTIILKLTLEFIPMVTL